MSYCDSCAKYEKELPSLRAQLAARDGEVERLNVIIEGLTNAAQIKAALAPSSDVMKEICMACDGTGWCEGSPSWECKDCKGSGEVAAPSLRETPDGE